MKKYEENTKKYEGILSPYTGRGTWKNFKRARLGEGVAKYELGVGWAREIHETCVDMKKYVGN